MRCLHLPRELVHGLLQLEALRASAAAQLRPPALGCSVSRLQPPARCLAHAALPPLVPTAQRMPSCLPSLPQRPLPRLGLCYQLADGARPTRSPLPHCCPTLVLGPCRSGPFPAWIAEALIDSSVVVNLQGNRWAAVL